MTISKNRQTDRPNNKYTGISDKVTLFIFKSEISSVKGLTIVYPFVT